MLINCPKCGFSQPQDRYCARCGVDMDSFVPKPPPLSSRLLKSPMTHVLFFVVTVFTSLQYVKYQEQKEIARRVAYLKGLPPGSLEATSRSTPNLASDESEALDEISTTASSNELSSASFTQKDEARGQTLTAASPMASPESSTLAEGTKNPSPGSENKLRVTETHPQQVATYLVEMSRNELNSLYLKAQQQGHFYQFADYTAGIVNSAQLGLEEFTQAPSLDKTIKALPENNPSNQWFAGKPSVEAEGLLGLTFYISINDIDRDSFKGTLEILRVLPESSENITITEKRPFQAQFDMSSKQKLFIAGILPRRPLSSQEESLYSDSFLKVLSSPRFLSGQTEFVIFFEFKAKAE